MRRASILSAWLLVCGLWQRSVAATPSPATVPPSAAPAAVAPAPLAAASAPPVRTEWHVGLNLRTDLGTHLLRAGAGVRRGDLDATLVLDPMFWVNDQHDLDLLIEWSPGGGAFAALVGWRTTIIGLSGGHQLQEHSLVGVTAALPTLAGGRIRLRWSLEMATLWVKHGGGLEATWISNDRALSDHIATGMFLRVEYAARL